MNGSRAFPAAMEHRLPQGALLRDGCTSRDGGEAFDASLSALTVENASNDSGIQV